jgi:uncharacterized LabA/DUF88 family protein
MSDREIKQSNIREDAFRNAIFLLENGNTKQAISLLQELQLLATAYSRMELWSEAESLYLSLISEVPNDSITYIRLAAIYMQSEQLHKARQLLEQATTTSPHNRELHRILGVIYMRLAEYHLAYRSLSIANDPKLLQTLKLKCLEKNIDPTQITQKPAEQHTAKEQDSSAPIADATGLDSSDAVNTELIANANGLDSGDEVNTEPIADAGDLDSGDEVNTELIANANGLDSGDEVNTELIANANGLDSSDEVSTELIADAGGLQRGPDQLLEQALSFENKELSSDISKKMVIFWDFENISLCNQVLMQFIKELSALTEDFEQRGGKILKRHCFGKWSKVPDLVQEYLDQRGFHLIQIPSTRKNILDQKLMIDAVDLFHQTTYSHFFLIAADGDYYSLCDTLKKHGVHIIIAGRWKSFSDDLKKLANDTYLIEESGHLNPIYRNTQREGLIQIISKSLCDAEAALHRMKSATQSRQVEIFSYREWLDNYKKLQHYLVHPRVVLEIISIRELFSIFLSTNAYGRSHDGLYFSIPVEQPPQEISAIECLQDLPQHLQIPTNLGLKSSNLPWDIELLFQYDLLEAGRTLIVEYFKANPNSDELLFAQIWSQLKVNRAYKILDTFPGIEDIPDKFFIQLGKVPPQQLNLTTNLKRRIWSKRPLIAANTTGLQQHTRKDKEAVAPSQESPIPSELQLESKAPEQISFQDQYMEKLHDIILSYQRLEQKQVNLSAISQVTAAHFKLSPSDALKKAGFRKFTRAIELLISRYGLKIALIKGNTELSFDDGSEQ